MTNQVNVNVLMDKITELTTAERITKKLLGELSRELLQLYVESGNIELINAILGKEPETGKFRLTPMNRVAAGYYFNQFIPHASNYDEWVEDNKVTLVFAGKSKRKVNRFAGKDEHNIEKWLSDENNNIWTWTATNVETKNNADVDYLGKLSKAFEQAIEHGVSKAEIIEALGLTAQDLPQAEPVLEEVLEEAA